MKNQGSSKYLEHINKHRADYRAAKPDLTVENEQQEMYYVQLPLVIFRMHHISPQARLFWAYLQSRCAQRHSGNTWPSMRRMSKNFGMSAGSIKIFVDELTAAGLIRVEKLKDKDGKGFVHHKYWVKHLREIVGKDALLDLWSTDDWILYRYPLDGEIIDKDPNEEGEGGQGAEPKRDLVQSAEHPLVQSAEHLVQSAERGLFNRLNEACSADCTKEDPSFKKSNLLKTNTHTERSSERLFSNPEISQPARPDIRREVEQDQALDSQEETPQMNKRDLIKEVFKKDTEVSDPGERSGFRKLLDHEKRLQKEERKAAKTHNQELREKAILEGSLERSTPRVRIFECFREAMGKAQLDCLQKAGPKDLVMWGNFIDKVGDYDKAENLVRYTCENWVELQNKYSKLDGSPGVGLFLGNWCQMLLKESSGKITGQTNAKGRTPKEEQQWVNAEEIATLMMKRRRKEAIDDERLLKLKQDWPNGDYIKEHLTRMGFYDNKP